MKKNIQAIRGMNDILPEETPCWQHVESVLKGVMKSYGYEEIRLPIVEYTDLFVRTIGEVTDIVEKEMYTFVDRGGDSLTLRPEGTAGCVRAGLEHGLLHNQIQRFWYQGPMFRHERPQKGRYRQFHQFGVEVFGLKGPAIDAELLLLTARIWRLLGVENQVALQLNTLGTSKSRVNYREALVAYFREHISLLDQDSQRRLLTNPLRILDSKNPKMRELIQNAPVLLDYLDAESQEHFAVLRRLLDAAGIKYVVNTSLVRGLDYYCHTVFEWTTTSLGSQGAICGGGHYDDLVAELGGRPTFAIGFGIGLERLVALVKNVTDCSLKKEVYLVMLGNEAEEKGFILAENLRDKLPGLCIVSNCDGGNFGNQMKRADKSGAELALIISKEEVESFTVRVKYLREEREEETVKAEDLALFLERNLALLKK